MVTFSAYEDGLEKHATANGRLEKIRQIMSIMDCNDRLGQYITSEKASAAIQIEIPMGAWEPFGIKMSKPAVSKRVRITGENGFHLRPISLLAELAGRFDSTITVGKEGMKVGARSVMELLLLGAQQGDELEVTAIGQDSSEAINAIEEFFNELAENDD